MRNTAFNLFSRKIKEVKWQKNYSCTAVMKKSDDFIIKSPLPSIVLSEKRFVDRLMKHTSGFMKSVAIECAETKKSYTYSQLQKHMASFGTSLHQKLGVKQGDVVCVMLPNRPEFPVVAFGALQSGCVLTTFNPLYKELEISHQISLTEPKVIVTLPECYDTVSKALKVSKRNAKIVLVDKPESGIPEGAIRYSEIVEKSEPDYGLLDKIEPDLDDVAVIPFSSGTTGLPKGVEITYRSMLSAVEIMMAKEVCFANLTTDSHQDILPCILPFFHIYGLVIPLIAHLSLGCKLVTMPKFSANAFLDLLKTQDVSLLYIVPPIAILLGKHPEVTKEHLRHVRFAVCGAAPLSSTDIVPILEKTGPNFQFVQGFGTTETTSLATTQYIGAKVKDPSSSGHPMSNVELKFLDPASGKPVPIGQSGELCVRSPSIMKGYHKNEAATKESIMEDGFYRTGDLGYYDPGDGLFITDRIKELIKVKGLQVAPAELEGILRSHPDVQDAAVIGVPHEFYGEVPKAIIINKKGKTTTPEELKEFVAKKVADFKKIEEVVFVENIPKTASGKVLRKDLKKMYS